MQTAKIRFYMNGYKNNLGQYMNRSTFKTIKYVNGSVFRPAIHVYE